MDNEPFKEFGTHAREHCRQQKDQQGAKEGYAAPDGDLLNSELPTTNGDGHSRQLGQLGQIDKDESQHHHTIKDAFYNNGCQRSRNGHSLAAL
ncbi:hypothetical protein SDC9_138021 [bioreactor metagenome]|uniref:Uncharacterized protein n=1 Tax=bioreactor metagenome TaxID=1076179 RepID=A0A645DP65_9ZZZZ